MLSFLLKKDKLGGIKMRKRIYLDYASTTPVDIRVFQVMEPYLKDKYGNTMSFHSFGQEVKVALEESRERVAKVIDANSPEIIFTASATESNNLALKGIALSPKSQGKHIVISSIEHPCIEESAAWLEEQGFTISRVPVDKTGVMNPAKLEKAIGKDTVLVSVIHASNEIGVIQDIETIGKICRAKKVLFHTDASQSFGKIPIDVQKMNIDLLTASSHKIYGPKGAALLYVKSGISIAPLLHGGGQERGIRSSTHNVPAIVGFGKAAEIAQEEMNSEEKRLRRLLVKLMEGVKDIVDAHLVVIHQDILPTIANFWFEDVPGDSLAIKLDLAGVAVSTGSACSTVKMEPSRILMAIGLSAKQARSSIRVSLGRETVDSHIDEFLEILKKAIAELRRVKKNNVI